MVNKRVIVRTEAVWAYVACRQVVTAENTFGTHSIASSAAPAAAQDATQQTAGSASQRKPQALSEKGTYCCLHLIAFDAPYFYSVLSEMPHCTVQACCIHLPWWDLKSAITSRSPSSPLKLLRRHLCFVGCLYRPDVLHPCSDLHHVTLH